MKEYNKEKLHEYAKELFALCLEKGLKCRYADKEKQIIIVDITHYYSISTYICQDLFRVRNKQYSVPIWELIEKVKAL